MVVHWLTEQAELAQHQGDVEGAKTWHEIAAAASRPITAAPGAGCCLFLAQKETLRLKPRGRSHRPVQFSRARVSLAADWVKSAS